MQAMPRCIRINYFQLKHLSPIKLLQRNLTEPNWVGHWEHRCDWTGVMSVYIPLFLLFNENEKWNMKPTIHFRFVTENGKWVYVLTAFM